VIEVAPESIERDVLIDAPPQTVWAVITLPEHVAGWFSDAAHIDLRPGGEVTLTWEGHGTAHGRVEVVEPPRLFAFRWLRAGHGEFREDNSTLVEFSLDAEGDGTRLRVVESGFRGLDASDDDTATYAEENRRGWKLELSELVDYVGSL
jgi:uncharacterized protein YndB with AHSA1/START domain